jgi:hypothetical protein
MTKFGLNSADFWSCHLPPAQGFSACRYSAVIPLINRRYPNGPAPKKTGSVSSRLARIYNRAMAEPRWSPEAVGRILMDPRYCLTQPPAVDEETWIKANAKMIRDMGAEEYLAKMLHLLRNDYV